MIIKTREELGEKVRNIWIGFAKERERLTGEAAKPGHLTEWNELDPENREVDMRIGQALYLQGFQDAMELFRSLESIQAIIDYIVEGNIL